MEENQQMINEQELDRKKKKRREEIRIFVVNWFEDDKTEKFIVSHVDKTFLLTVENQLIIDIWHEMWLQKRNNQVSYFCLSHENARNNQRK